VNTAAFDAMAAAGQLKVDAVLEDAINVRKVTAGRIPLAVIDGNVLTYLLTHDASLRAARGRVQFNARRLEDKALHVAFQRSAAGEAAAPSTRPHASNSGWKARCRPVSRRLWRSAISSSWRSSIAACSSGRKKRVQSRPSALACYMAMSACFGSVSMSAPSLGNNTTPMLALRWWLCSPTRIG
jgi:hypothetical protein